MPGDTAEIREGCWFPIRGSYIYILKDVVLAPDVQLVDVWVTRVTAHYSDGRGPFRPACPRADRGVFSVTVLL